MTSVRAVGYTRVSTEEQAEGGYSLDAQRDAITKFAELRGMTLISVYEERGRSGKSALRPEFQRMIGDAEAGAFDVIIVHKLDRFSRSLIDVLNYLGRLEKKNVSFVSVTEAFDFTNPFGRLVLTLLAALAEWYLNNLRDEVRKGKKERARQGDWNGTLSWGYTTPRRLNQQLSELGEQFKLEAIAEDDYSKQCAVIEGCLEQHEHKHETAAIIDPVASQGVVLAFSAYSTGKYSDREIADLLNEHGYRISSHKRKDNLFGKETVSDVLRNRFYIGETSYGGTSGGSSRHRKVAQYMAGAHQAIISRSLFAKVQEVRAKRTKKQMSHSTKLTKEVFPLTGMLICADCGTAWSGWSKENGRFYRRRTKHVNCTTTKLSVSAARIELEVYSFLKGIRIPENWREMLIELTHENDDSIVERIKERLVYQKQLERLQRLFQLGDIDEATYIDEATIIKRKIAEVDAQGLTAEVSEAEKLVKMLGNLAKVWQQGSLEDKRIIARHLIRYIYIEEGFIKAIEPTPVMWVLLQTGYSVRGEQVLNPHWDTNILAPDAPLI